MKRNEDNTKRMSMTQRLEAWRLYKETQLKKQTSPTNKDGKRNRKATGNGFGKQIILDQSPFQESRRQKMQVNECNANGKNILSPRTLNQSPIKRSPTRSPVLLDVTNENLSPSQCISPSINKGASMSALKTPLSMRGSNKYCLNSAGEDGYITAYEDMGLDDSPKRDLSVRNISFEKTSGGRNDQSATCRNANCQAKVLTMKQEHNVALNLLKRENEELKNALNKANQWEKESTEALGVYKQAKIIAEHRTQMAVEDTEATSFMNSILEQKIEELEINNSAERVIRNEHFTKKSNKQKLDLKKLQEEKAEYETKAGDMMQEMSDQMNALQSMAMQRIEELELELMSERKKNSDLNDKVTAKKSHASRKSAAMSRRQSSVFVHLPLLDEDDEENEEENTDQSCSVHVESVYTTEDAVVERLGNASPILQELDSSTETGDADTSPKEPKEMYSSSDGSSECDVDAGVPIVVDNGLASAGDENQFDEEDLEFFDT